MSPLLVLWVALPSESQVPSMLLRKCRRRQNVARSLCVLAVDGTVHASPKGDTKKLKSALAEWCL